MARQGETDGSCALLIGDSGKRRVVIFADHDCGAQPLGYSNLALDRAVPYLCDKAVALAGNSDDVAMLGGIVAKGLSQEVDVSRQAPFFDEGVGPKGAHQFILLNHLPASSNQEQ